MLEVLRDPQSSTCGQKVRAPQQAADLIDASGHYERCMAELNLQGGDANEADTQDTFF